MARTHSDRHPDPLEEVLPHSVPVAAFRLQIRRYQLGRSLVHVDQLRLARDGVRNFVDHQIGLKTETELDAEIQFGQRDLMRHTVSGIPGVVLVRVWIIAIPGLCLLG